ncbi:MAG TPA: ferredoxin [Streptosporangiaceae bacterium]|nr:ferredoxin [Streptosporangiaceae bacterium]
MSKRIRVNPVACSGHGACAELLPELIALDDWGYPIISALPVSGQVERRARRAVAGCPALALILTPDQPAGTAARGLQREFRASSETRPS